MEDGKRLQLSFHVAPAKVWRDISRASICRRWSIRSMLGVVEGEVLNFQTVGHVG